ncbi:hypothetical protein L3X38_032703 [Prunus dulcis]|uniref:Uncharacterized protein n=1 Tax=Prunus dulcis TaxID=3755 RepID=A0AAD4YW50_PRUDU|nr:hypothetical protein L3X38_032703 [Prunus dulcis]
MVTTYPTPTRAVANPRSITPSRLCSIIEWVDWHKRSLIHSTVSVPVPVPVPVPVLVPAIWQSHTDGGRLSTHSRFSLNFHSIDPQ